MTRTSVTSSWVASVGYDPSIMTLEVELGNGSVYLYFDVPETVYRDLMSASSVGTYLNQHIKDRYRCTQL